MNSGERLAARTTHKRTADRWRAKYAAFEARADTLADRIRAIEKRAKDAQWGAVRMRRATAPLMLAVSSLLGSQARCDAITGRHDARVRALAEPS